MRAVSRRIVGVALLMGLLGTVVFGGTASAASADAGHNWGSVLHSGNEVPAGGSGASGIAYFHVNDDGMSVSYTVSFWNIVDPMMGHIHLGAAGSNGPVVVQLLDPKNAVKGNYSGTLVSGTFTAKDLTGPLQGKSIDDLFAAFKSGNAYTNFHTAADPGGASRGQVVSFEDLRLLG